jgi:FKBP-type peptidyl-prolyl cis-trans isomerase
MPQSFVRTRGAIAFAALLTTAAISGCSLGGDTSLPPFTDPATINYEAATGVNITTMTRLTQAVYSKDSVVGTGRTVVVGDSIAVYYNGKLNTGFSFDRRARPSTTFETVLDSTRIIPGWIIGIQGMKVGGIRKIVIGPESAYGYERRVDGAGNTIIPSNSVLVFDVEMVNATAR